MARRDERRSKHQTFRGFVETLAQLDMGTKRFDALKAAKVALGRKDT